MPPVLAAERRSRVKVGDRVTWRCGTFMAVNPETGRGDARLPLEHSLHCNWWSPPVKATVIETGHGGTRHDPIVKLRWDNGGEMLVWISELTQVT